MITNPVVSGAMSRKSCEGSSSSSSASTTSSCAGVSNDDVNLALLRGKVAHRVKDLSLGGTKRQGEEPVGFDIGVQPQTALCKVEGANGLHQRRVGERHELRTWPRRRQESRLPRFCQIAKIRAYVSFAATSGQRENGDDVGNPGNREDTEKPEKRREEAIDPVHSQRPLTIAGICAASSAAAGALSSLS